MTVQRICPQDALELMDEGWAYLDVRTPAEFDAGHPKGAYNIPWKIAGPQGMEPNPRFVEVVDRTFGKDGKIIVGCERGGRSRAAAEALLAAGFSHVVDQLAGFGGATDSFGRTVEPGWRDAGLPVTTEALPGRSWADLAG